MSFSPNLTIVDETQTFANLSVLQNFFFSIKRWLYRNFGIVNHNAHRVYFILLCFGSEPPQLLW